MDVALALVAGLAVVGALAAFAVWRVERWARDRGLSAVRQELADVLGVDDVALEVPARPLLPALVRPPGTVATLRALDVPVGDDDGRLRDLDADVAEVRVHLRERRLTTGDGTFRATIDQEQLGRMVQLPGVVARLELRRDRLRVWTVLGVPVDTEVRLERDALRVVPDPLQVRDLLRLPGLSAFRRTLEAGGLSLPLPRFPLDARIDHLELREGCVVASGTFRGIDRVVATDRSGPRG